MKLRHKVNHGWTPPSSPLRNDPIDARYEGEVAASVRRAEKAWRKAQKALQSAQRRFEAKPDPARLDAVEELRKVVEARFLELRELELLMQGGPVGGTNHSGKGSAHNPLPKGTKL